MTALINTLVNLHHATFQTLERLTGGWLTGLLARFTFLGVLFFYFFNSAKTKISEGLFGIFQIRDGAYFQILGEEGMLAYDFEVANIPWFIDIIVALGTYGEFILPALIVLGLFTRIAAIGMIIFIAVQTYVDITVHKVDDKTIGALFDRFSDSLLMDQRTLWFFVLAYLLLKGAGAISLDAILSRWWQNRAE